MDGTNRYRHRAILLVEDDVCDSHLIKNMLQRTGIGNPVFHARDGLEALETLEKMMLDPTLEQPFLLLVDIYMPRMNGLQFLLRLRTEDHLRHHTAVVLTTSDWTHDKARAYSLHAAAYIQKDRIQDLGQFVRRQCSVKTVSVKAMEIFNNCSAVPVPCG